MALPLNVGSLLYDLLLPNLFIFLLVSTADLNHLFERVLLLRLVKNDLSHVFSGLWLHSIHSCQVLTVAEGESGLFKVGSLYELPQVDLSGLVVPNVLLLMCNFGERKWRRRGVAVCVRDGEFAERMLNVLRGQNMALGVSHDFLGLLEDLNYLRLEVCQQEV